MLNSTSEGIVALLEENSMKNLMTGIALAAASLATVPQAEASCTMGSMGKLVNALGNFTIRLGLEGVYSRKKVKTTTEIVTSYNAGYLYGPDGANLLVGNWTQPLPAAPGLNDILNLGFNAVVNNVPQALVDVGRMYMYNGILPAQWLRGVTLFKPAARDMAAAAFCDPALGAQNPDILPHRKLVESSKHDASASRTSDIDCSGWGMRIEGGLGYKFLPTLTGLVLVSYNFDISGKHEKDRTVSELDFKTEGVVEKLKFLLNTEADANLVETSFAYNSGVIAQNVSVTANVKETLSIMGALEYAPSSCLGIFLKAGVRRYDLEAKYTVEDLAFPGTVGAYTDDFVQNNGRHVLLISQKGSTKSLINKGTAWTFAFGGGVSIVFADIISVKLGVDYATFSEDLKHTPDNSKTDGDKSESSDNKDVAGAQLTMSNPYEAPPTAAQMRAHSQGTHQFVATDVVTTFKTRMDVTDLSFNLGLSVRL